MIHEEMAWVDDQAPNERAYWFPGLFPETWQVLEQENYRKRKFNQGLLGLPTQEHVENNYRETYSVHDMF